MIDKKNKIAIVGMSCRFPGGANSPEEYWDVLKEGRDVVTEIGSERWGTDYYLHHDRKEPGKSVTFAAGVLDQVDQFDADFFGITPREAAQMDPQQRLLLELTWESLEDAGQKPVELAGSQCAVYIGIASTDYVHRRVDDLSSMDAYSMTGNTASIASNRLSYVFDLHGPSVSIDTACSSSLVALHQACNAIRNGEAPMAITGGVNMLLHPFAFVGFSKASMISSRGRCRAFDASGDGYVRSEGAAVLVLKPLEQAELDGDRIHGVIAASGVNCDGKTNGITVPSPEGQGELLARIYQQNNVDPDALTYVEAHGTGTSVGDPREAQAIGQVLGQKRSKPLPIGSVKTNVGHLETASGMAGLVKALMMMRNHAMPENLHFKKPNPDIDFDGLNLQVVDSFQPLADHNEPMMIGVNSFGFGGANAHVLVEEYQTEEVSLGESDIQNHSLPKQNRIVEHVCNLLSPLYLSANSQDALHALVEKYHQRIIDTPEQYPALAWSAHKNRQLLKHRVAFSAPTVDELSETLSVYQHEASNAECVALSTDVVKSPLALVFSGNGAQWQGMGQVLLESSDIFSATINEIQKLFDQYCLPSTALSLKQEIGRSKDKSRLAETEIAQPLLFALQVGVMRILQARGVQYQAVLGHSVGEVAAAWACGALTLEQAVQVIFERSKAQGQTRGSGRMAAVGLGLEDITGKLNEYHLQDCIEVAGVNSVKGVTLSGLLDDLERLQAFLEPEGTFFRILDLDYAFHSSHMDTIQEGLENALSTLQPVEGHTRFISTVTGGELAGQQLDAHYWWKNIRHPVLFADALSELVTDDYQVFIEVGSHPILRSYINDACREGNIQSVVLPTIERDKEALHELDALSHKIALSGCGFDETQVFSQTDTHVELPRYPWQRERYWYAKTDEGYDLVNRSLSHPLLGYRVRENESIWENHLDTLIAPWLAGHVVDDGVVVPAAAYAEMALAASAIEYETNHTVIDNLEILAPIVLDHTKKTRFELEGDGYFTIQSKDRLTDAAWTLNAKGRLLQESYKHPDTFSPMVFSDNAKQCDGADHYALASKVGLDYGASFQAISAVSTEGYHAEAFFSIPDSIKEGYDKFHLHPSLLDGCFQVLVDIFGDDIHAGKTHALIPVQMGQIVHYPHSKVIPVGFTAQVTKQSPRSVLANFTIYGRVDSDEEDEIDASLHVITELRDCRFRGVQFAHRGHHAPATYTFKPWLLSSLEEQPVQWANLQEWMSEVVDSATTHAQQSQYHYQEVLPLFDVLVSAYAWEAFINVSKANTHSNDIDKVEEDFPHLFKPEWLKQTNDEDSDSEDSISITHSSAIHPLVYKLLAILEEDGLAIKKKIEIDAEVSSNLSNDGSNDEAPSQSESYIWHIANETEWPSARDIWLSILGDAPQYIPELMMLGRCGEYVTEIVTGKIPYSSLIRSEKSSTYDHWIDASSTWSGAQQSLLSVMQAGLKTLPVTHRLQVLEIGAGSIESLSQRLSVMPSQQIDYLVLTSDESWFSRASLLSEQYAFFQVQLLESTDLALHAALEQFSNIDWVVLNSVSSTAWAIDEMLPFVQATFTSSGRLIVLDTAPNRFNDLIMGSNEHWWGHSIENTQPVSQHYSSSEWNALLSTHQFSDIAIWNDEFDITESGSFLMLAESGHAIPKTNGMTPLNDTKDIVLPEVAPSQKHQPLIIAHIEMVSSDGDCQQWLDGFTQAYEEFYNVAPILLADESLEKNISASALPSDTLVLSYTKQGFDEIWGKIKALYPDVSESFDIIALDVSSFNPEPIQNSGVSTQNTLVHVLTSLLQSLTEQQIESALTIVTQNAATVSMPSVEKTQNSPVHWQYAVGHSPVWGFARVAMNEYPDINCRIIDWQSEGSNSGTALNGKGNDVARAMGEKLVREIAHQSDENEIILTQNARYGTRMQSIAVTPDKKTDNSVPMVLDFKSPGPLKNLYWRDLGVKTVAADEIEIRPYAAGLNFRDVMYAMGLLSDEAVENGFAGPTLGMELAGKVVAVGADVNEFALGDDVIGFAPACFSTRVITQTTAVAHKPEQWSYQEAATIPTTFFTIYYALKHLAQMEEGEKVLIHGAAGGVGIAAIQYARAMGAEIFATAGSDEKRDFVKMMGADHVMDSRSLSFADEIMEITQGEGVDIVLNSLAGEAINRNLSVLKPFGRFLELGKRDFYENSKIGLRPFRNNITYFGIDADQLLIEKPKLAGRLFREMMALFEEGMLRPLPHRVFQATDIAEAFRYMQQSRQIGKVIVSLDGDLPISEPTLDAASEHLQLSKDKSYLVTGGTSGFGLKTALWLAQKGAGELLLLSRSGQLADQDHKTLANIEALGCQAHIVACDVTDQSALNALLEQDTYKPLAGIVHAAMVLDDGLIRNMTDESISKVLAPKVEGAWNLHQLSLTDRIKSALEFFVLYSSATTFLGNPGQANYVAGNSFLESLAYHRQSQGLPATFAAWGAIDDVGFLARNEETKEALQSRLGGQALTSDQALDVLEKMLLNPEIAGAAVIDFDWNAIKRLMPSAQSAKYTEQLAQLSTSDGDQYDDIQTLLADLSRDESIELVTGMLLDEIGHILRLPKEKLDAEKSVFDLGMDSLMGMELVLAIEERFGVKLPVMALTEGASVSRVSDRIIDQLISDDASDEPVSEYEDKVMKAVSVHAADMSEQDAKQLTDSLVDRKAG